MPMFNLIAVAVLVGNYQVSSNLNIKIKITCLKNFFSFSKTIIDFLLLNSLRNPRKIIIVPFIKIIDFKIKYTINYFLFVILINLFSTLSVFFIIVIILNLRY